MDPTLIVNAPRSLPTVVDRSGPASIAGHRCYHRGLNHSARSPLTSWFATSQGLGSESLRSVEHLVEVLGGDRSAELGGHEEVIVPPLRSGEQLLLDLSPATLTRARSILIAGALRSAGLHRRPSSSLRRHPQSAARAIGPAQRRPRIVARNGRGTPITRCPGWNISWSEGIFSARPERVELPTF